MTVWPNGVLMLYWIDLRKKIAFRSDKANVVVIPRTPINGSTDFIQIELTTEY